MVNGDLGRIASIDQEDGKILVDFEISDRYDSDEWDEISLAYATSIHKARAASIPWSATAATSTNIILYAYSLHCGNRGKKLVIVAAAEKPWRWQSALPVENRHTV